MDNGQYIIPQYEPVFGELEEKAMTVYMKSGGWITEHKQTRKFEDIVCDFTGSKYCFAVNNGTIALAIALKAVGVNAGDEVIVPDFTMIATATAVSFIGAIPIFVDTYILSACLDYQIVESYITNKTKAIIYVSLNGRGYGVEDIKEICNRKGIAFVEDAAQSFGSFYKEKALGTYGDVGCYSLSTQKIISTGQGGLIVTDDIKIATIIRRLKDFGRAADGSDNHVGFGINAKFTDIQAVIGIAQIRTLPDRMEAKRMMHQIYHRELSFIGDINMLLPNGDDGYTPWFIDIYIQNPYKLQIHLRKKGIITRRVYLPLHKQPCYYNSKNKEMDYTVSNYFSERGLWLPSSIILKVKYLEKVCDAIKEYYKY